MAADLTDLVALTVSELAIVVSPDIDTLYRAKLSCKLLKTHSYLKD